MLDKDFETNQNQHHATRQFGTALVAIAKQIAES